MLLVLNGFLPVAVKESCDGHLSQPGPIQAIFTENERDTAMHVARVWYSKGYKPRLISKTWDGEFTTLFDFRNYDRAAKAKATKAARRKAA